MVSNKWQILKHTAKLYDLCALGDGIPDGDVCPPFGAGT